MNKLEAQKEDNLNAKILDAVESGRGLFLRPDDLLMLLYMVTELQGYRVQECCRKPEGE